MDNYFRGSAEGEKIEKRTSSLSYILQQVSSAARNAEGAVCLSVCLLLALKMYLRMLL
jgi:hypothetical protein